jgi:enoyl-CoA hydratase
MAYQNIIYETKEGVGIITVNRPKVLNALSKATLDELEDAFKKALSDPSVSVVILTGVGEKAFVAGADINEIAELDFDSGKRFAQRGQDLLNLIENGGKPVIAAVNGFALGGGTELALACHIRIASNNARFGQPEVKLGIIPGYGGTQRLPRIVGKGRGLEMILTGEMIDAQRAYEIGLVNKVVELPKLMEEAFAMAKKIMAVGPLAVKCALEAVNRGLELTLADGLKVEADMFARACGSEDKKEGTSAFLSKRTPKFSGR